MFALSKARIYTGVSHDVEKIFLRCYLICPGLVVARPLHMFNPANTSEELYTNLTSMRRLITKEHLQMFHSPNKIVEAFLQASKTEMKEVPSMSKKIISGSPLFLIEDLCEGM